MTGRISSQMAIVAFLRVAAAATSCLLCGAACSAGRGGCGAGEKCPGPALPDATVHLGIGGTSASLNAGATTHAFAKRGLPTKITLSIERPANVTVSNVWLVVQSNRSQHSAAVANAPFAHFSVVLDRKGLLRSTETLSATWTPTAQPGTKNLNLGISMDLGDAGVSWPIATVTV